MLRVSSFEPLSISNTSSSFRSVSRSGLRKRVLIRGSSLSATVTTEKSNVSSIPARLNGSCPCDEATRLEPSSKKWCHCRSDVMFEYLHAEVFRPLKGEFGEVQSEVFVGLHISHFFTELSATRETDS